MSQMCSFCCVHSLVAKSDVVTYCHNSAIRKHGKLSMLR